MPKKKLYRDVYSGKSVLYKVNNLDDIFDTSRFHSVRVRNFRTLFKDTGENAEQRAKQKAKNIFKDFMESVVTGIIDNNEVFVFPERDFGYMTVTDMTNEDHKRYKFDISTDGKVFLPRIALMYNKLKLYGKYYKLRFNRKFTLRLVNSIESGIRY